MDVSPSVEQAEQELIEHYNVSQQPPGGPPRITAAPTGTISGMLADFSKALGLSKLPSPGATTAVGPSPEHQEAKANKSEPPSGKSATSGAENVKSGSEKKQSIHQREHEQKEHQDHPQKQLKEETKDGGVGSEQKATRGSGVSTTPCDLQEHKQNATQEQKNRQKHVSPEVSGSSGTTTTTSTTTTSSRREPGHHHNKKVQRKLPQPTVEQMHAALAGSSRHKARSMAVVSGSASVTSSSVPSITRRSAVPQMGTNVIRVEALQQQHHHHHYDMTDGPKVSEGANTRLTSTSSPYRIIDSTTSSTMPFRLRPEGKQVSPNSSPDDMLIKSGYVDGRKISSTSFLSSSGGQLYGMSAALSKDKVSTALDFNYMPWFI